MLYQPTSKFAYDPAFSLDSVAWNKRSRHEFVTYAGLAVQRAVGEGQHSAQELGPYLFNWATDTRMLRYAWDRLSKYGGPAPGPNGRRYTDFQEEEVWDLLKTLSEMLRAGTFAPAPPRKVPVPKDIFDPSKGDRYLGIANIEDRTSQLALLQLIQPLRDSFLDERIYGGRRHRSRLEALAHGERRAIDENRWVFLTEDINNAFDCVPRQRLQNLLAKVIPCQELAKLMVKLSASHPKHGIHQGGPLSPFLLNEYLNRYLMEPARKKLSDVPLLLYMDDMLALCKTQKEAGQAWTSLRDILLAAGFKIKGSKPKDRIRDLRKGEAVQWLGYRMTREDGKLIVRIANKAWSNLYANLVLAHEKPNSPLWATATIEGWLDQAGACYEHEDREKVLDKIRAWAGNLAFDEIPGNDALHNRWQEANSRWQKVRAKASTPATPAMAVTVAHSDFDPDEAPF